MKKILKKLIDLYKKDQIVRGIIWALIIVVGLMFCWYITIPLAIFIYLWKKFKKNNEIKKNMKNEIIITKCPKCKMEIDPEATRCPHCRGKISKPMSNLMYVFIVMIFTGIVISMVIADSKPNNTSSVANSTPTDNMIVGDSGYIKLPNDPDTTQKICLGETIDDAKQISKALSAKDYLGLLQIPGAFCVSNGTQALLIEKSFPWRKARITGTISKIDEDKFGMSGWLPMEWVTK